ncbi:Gfo/Idh/MocA family protein [Rhodovibrionaceae bacterium A322]
MTITAAREEAGGRRLRLGMVGGGEGAFIGAVHRIAARLDDRYELVAGAFSSDPDRSHHSAIGLHVSPDRAYDTYQEMAEEEAKREDCIDVVAIVTPNHLHAPVATAFLSAGIHVICDKPLTTSLDQALEMEALVIKKDLFFGLTHNYAGYPLIRHARAMVQAGDLGDLRVVQAEYVQDWLTEPIETQGQKQAAWRTDPERSGPVGCLGDIGTHAFHISRFVSGLEVAELSAELTSFVEGRRLDDHAQVMLRYEGGARGMIWSSQVCPGNENGLKLRIYGTKGGLEWNQENPNELIYSPFGEPPRRLTRGGPGLGPEAEHASRIPPGHPEGYLEGFAQLYSDFADQITAKIDGGSPDPLSLSAPGIADGVNGVRFISRALESSHNNGGWTAF